MEAIRFGRRRGTYVEFSNFHPCDIIVDGIRYKNTESAFQAGKTTDDFIRREFSLLTGSQAKKKGRTISLRRDWEQIKFQRMVEVNLAKFQDETLKQILLSTGSSYLIEDTTGWHDNEWGCCNCPGCFNKRANNKHGLALMIVRSKLRGESGVNVDIKFDTGDVFHLDLIDCVDSVTGTYLSSWDAALSLSTRKML